MVAAEHHLVAKDILRTFKSDDGTELIALQNFNLEVDHGEVVALIGPSGCG